MLAASRASTRRVASASAAKAVAPRPLRVVCNASLKPAELVRKAAAVATTLPVLLATSPAFALVDERLNGDGTGLPFGINDSALGWIIVGVLGSIWTVWFTSQRDLGDFEDTDAGLKIEDLD